MVALRAHFDGRVIVPDEPVHLALDAQVVVLVDADASAPSPSLEDATRDYYLSQSPQERQEDEHWGSVLHGGQNAWDQE
jgi:hypothetical protein